MVAMLVYKSVYVKRGSVKCSRNKGIVQHNGAPWVSRDNKQRVLLKKHCFRAMIVSSAPEMFVGNEQGSSVYLAATLVI